MNPERLSMLTPKTVNFEGGSRGIPVITWEMIAGGLARCSDFQYYLLTAKYAADQGSKHKAWAQWFVRCMGMGWQDVPGRVERFTTITLQEFVDPMVCGRCNGVGEVMLDTKIVLCETCEGSKYLPYTERRIARAIGMGYKLYAWSDRLEWAREQLAKEESEGLKIAR